MGGETALAAVRRLACPVLSRPSTRRRLKDESRRGTDGRKAVKSKLLGLAAPFRSCSAPKHVDGQDQPGQDASGPARAAPNSAIPWLQQLKLQEPAFYCEKQNHVLYVFDGPGPNGSIAACPTRGLEEARSGCGF